LVCGRADERHRMGIMVLDSKSSERRYTATLPLTWQDGTNDANEVALVEFCARATAENVRTRRCGRGA
jgi:hypothetical protein